MSHAHLVSHDVKKLGSTILNSTNNSYWANQLGGTRYQVFLIQTQATSSDLDGSVMPTVTSAYQYDAYSNPTQIVVLATDGFSKTTTNTYTNDTTNWFLGRLTNASVASLITSPGSPPAQIGTTVVISNSTNNLNLWNYLLSAGVATAGTPGTWTVVIANGVVIGSNSTTVAALDTGALPSGSSLTLVNEGTIVGAGGTGGSVTQQPGGVTVDNAGTDGGTAIRAQAGIGIINYGSIWGGGGGGGSGPTSGGPGSGAGGGGAGVIGGPGGTDPTVQSAGQPTPPQGSPGTISSGGTGTPYVDPNTGNTVYGPSGGGPALPGVSGTAAGGAAGAATSGNSFITWITVGDRRGPLN